MSRYVLRYSGAEAIPADHVKAVRSIPGVHVLDESPKMLLVDGDESALHNKLKEMPGWSIHPETVYTIPDTRKKLS